MSWQVMTHACNFHFFCFVFVLACLALAPSRWFVMAYGLTLNTTCSRSWGLDTVCSETTRVLCLEIIQAWYDDCWLTRPLTKWLSCDILWPLFSPTFRPSKMHLKNVGNRLRCALTRTQVIKGSHALLELGTSQHKMLVATYKKNTVTVLSRRSLHKAKPPGTQCRKKALIRTVHLLIFTGWI
jgi:hypothetical protein